MAPGSLASWCGSWWPPGAAPSAPGGCGLISDAWARAVVAWGASGGDQQAQGGVGMSKAPSPLRVYMGPHLQTSSKNPKFFQKKSRMRSPAEILASLPEAERGRYAPPHLGGGSTGRALPSALNVGSQSHSRRTAKRCRRS